MPRRQSGISYRGDPATGERVSNPRQSLFTAIVVGIASLAFVSTADAQQDAPPGSIAISADVIRTWEDRGLQFLLMEGDCRISQDDKRVRCGECLAWTPAQRGGVGERVEFHFVGRQQVEVDVS